MKGLFWLFITIGSVMGIAKEDYAVEKLCESPRIYYIENFVTDKECDYLIKLAEPHLERSRVVGDQAHKHQLNSARTSSGAFLRTGNDPILQSLERRIAKFTGFPVENGEDFHVLHYDVSQEYKPHYDFFDHKTGGGQAALKRGGQRQATFIIYLHDTEEGGETIFPSVDVSVPAKKRNAVLFYNVTPEGELEHKSLHGGAPVKKGEKWIVTRWLREGRFH